MSFVSRITHTLRKLFLGYIHNKPTPGNPNPRADPSYETVYVCHGRPIHKEYPIPVFCSPVFVKTDYIGAQEVDIYQIIQKENSNDE